MRLAVLVPDPGYEEPWAWAFDVEADALKAAGCTVDAVAWTELDQVDGYDLVLPLVRGRALADDQPARAAEVE